MLFEFWVWGFGFWVLGFRVWVFVLVCVCVCVSVAVAGGVFSRCERPKFEILKILPIAVTLGCEKQGSELYILVDECLRNPRSPRPKAQVLTLNSGRPG